MLVTAGIILKEGKILIAKRKGEKWEFPGGKVERGEGIEECLKRELKEELNIRVDSIEPFCKVKDNGIELHVFIIFCDEEPVAGVHEELKWVDMNEIDRYEFMNADKKVVEEIKSRGLKNIKFKNL